MSLYKLKASVTYIILLYIYIGILWPLEIKQLTGNRSKLWELNLTSMIIIHFKLKLMG